MSMVHALGSTSLMFAVGTRQASATATAYVSPVASAVGFFSSFRNSHGGTFRHHFQNSVPVPSTLTT
jgi:hypothetical protein